MQDTHEEVKKHLLNIFNKKENSLPEWALLVDVARMAKYERSYTNVTFATWVYYAIKDLLTPVKHVWIEYKKVNKRRRSVTWVIHEAPGNKPGATSGEIIKIVDKNKWNRRFENKSVEELNRNVTSSPVQKAALYHITEYEIFIDDNLNIVGVEGKLDASFRPVVDTAIPVMTFEDVISKLLPSDKKTISEDSSNLSHAIIALTHFYPFEAKDAGARGIPNEIRAKIICDQHNLTKKNAPAYLLKKYNTLKEASERLRCFDREIDFKNRLELIKNAWENIDSEKFPKGKQLAEKEYLDYNRKYKIEKITLALRYKLNNVNWL